MRECSGVTFETVELEHFQKHFWGSPSAALLERMFEVVSDHWTKHLTSIGASDTGMRQAQGALDALGTVMELAQKLAGLPIEGEEVKEEIDAEEDTPDVRF